jgi:hypothetical protein
MDQANVVVDAERSFTHLYWWIQNRFTVVYAFRRVGELGLPYARPHLLEEWRAFTTRLAEGPDLERFVGNTTEFLKLAGGVNGMARELADSQISHATLAVDAASLVFAHSIADHVATECLRITALVAPEDWEQSVAERKVSLGSLKGETYESRLTESLRRYLAEVERWYLPRKIQRLFEVCKPPDDYCFVRGYRYDSERLVRLDSLRVHIVHKAEPIPHVPSCEGEISFLLNTCLHLMGLVNQRYGVKVQPHLLPGVVASAAGSAT